jgi:hypothetical protein
VGWAYAARTAERDLVLLYFEKDCPQVTVAQVRPNGTYTARWFDPRTGRWRDAGLGELAADSAGNAALPRFPGGATVARDDWALKLKLADQR